MGWLVIILTRIWVFMSIMVVHSWFLIQTWLPLSMSLWSFYYFIIRSLLDECYRLEAYGAVSLIELGANRNSNIFHHFKTHVHYISTWYLIDLLFFRIRSAGHTPQKIRHFYNSELLDVYCSQCCKKVNLLNDLEARLKNLKANRWVFIYSITD